MCVKSAKEIFASKQKAEQIRNNGIKMIKKLLLASVLVSSTQVVAAVKCPEAKIQMLRPTEDKLFIQLEGQTWHVLALKADSDYNQKMFTAMSAQRTGKKVELQFPNGYDDTCMSSDDGVVAENIKLIKKSRVKG